MNWLTGIFSGGAASTVDAVGTALDKLFTSDEEKLDKKALLERLRQRPMDMQNAINLAQVQHRSIFVAGARPFIMWVCGFALAWHFIGYDLAVWIAHINEWPSESVPKISGTESLTSLTVSLLGLGALRTVEKAKGLTR